ncbi:MAG TPA: adenylate/guanylate cyclase domain-containing protein [Ilumatobacteraceae bacterium]|nr:adenylate/guanylate cyclase domain-containing protein [Ilumatobacteraceae bacterium]
MTQPPEGAVTFLFTDIVGSTALWDQHPEAMTDALAEHDKRIGNIVDRLGGYVFTTAGDSFAVAFESATAALTSAVEILLATRNPVKGLDLPVRIGVHTGTATLRNGDYFGGAVNRAARISASAHAHQIVVSQPTVDQLGADPPDDVSLLDLGIHRLRGLAEPAHLHQVRHPELPAEHPRLRTVEGPDDTLPVQLTSFVGRSREVTDVGDLVRKNRMVTLSGAGGAGKTRLAVRVATQMVADFPDGLRMAELGAVGDADVLVEEVAQRFGVTPVGGEPLLTTLTETIGAQQVLLVLDNCEQIVGPVAGLCRNLLIRCPQLHVLATSRQRLGVTGEVVYRVPSLALPDPDIEPGAAMAYDAIRLFVERARLAEHAFEVTDDNVRHVVAICRHLDGIPLALELAAARIRSMSPAQIVQRLGQRFRLLTGADRTATPRQETLLSTIEWSHDLLDEAERTLFRRLGVFSGDFPLEAAEAACAGDDLDEFDVLDLIAALVDKSMVATGQGTDAATRYYLLESIREFAAGRLDDAAETATLRERHAEHFAHCAETLQAMQRAGELAEALRRLDADEAEYRGALRFSTGTRRHELAGRIIGGLGYLWYTAGLYREGCDWCRALLDDDPVLSDEIRAGVLHSYASVLSGDGHADRAIELSVEQVAIRRRLGDPERLAAALNNLGNHIVDMGDLEASSAVFDEAAELYRELGRSAELALVYCSLGYGQLVRGDYGDAEATYREALAHARDADHPMSIAVSMSGIGQSLTYACRGDAARPHLVEARERFAELNVYPGVVTGDTMLGLVDRDDDDPVAAARHWLSALNSPGRPWTEDETYSVLQYAASIIDDLPTAAVLVGAATAAYDAMAARPPAYVVADLAATRTRLVAELSTDEFGTQLRAGGRRTKDEAIATGTAALEAYLAAAERTETSHAD